MTTKNPPTPRALPLLLAAFLISLPAQAQYGGGTGEPNDPWLIYTPEQMNAIGADPHHWDKHFKLMADIDLSEYGETRFNIIGNALWATGRKPFTGVFDGNDHTISNFTWSSSSRDCVGLFGYVDDPNAQIKSLGLIDPNVRVEETAPREVGRTDSLSVARSIGALVGYLEKGTLIDCHVQGGQVSGYGMVGGLVGFNAGGAIMDSHTTTQVSGMRDTGGLVGYNHGIVSGCHAHGAVTGDYVTAGLVGRNVGIIINCYATGTTDGGPNVGGLVGLNVETITNCYATATVRGNSGVGGLVGHGYGGTVTDCNSAGTAHGTDFVGGLVGSNRATIMNCRSSSTVAGRLCIGGLVGDSGDSEITNSHAIGSATGESIVGGLVGGAYGKITDCYSTGEVYGTQRVGGLVGSSSAEIRDCYSTNDVYGTETVGGLIGSHRWGTVANCCSRGMVWGTRDVGGLVGFNDGTIINCYAVGLTVGTERMGGLVASASPSYYRTAIVTGSFWDIQTTRQLTSVGGTGKSTLKMQSADTFLSAGWDFVGETTNGTEEIWWIDEGKDYPRLWWEAAPE